jgi:hypothetical protein
MGLLRASKTFLVATSCKVVIDDEVEIFLFLDETTFESEFSLALTSRGGEVVG